jgi:hypothetical protein
MNRLDSLTMTPSDELRAAPLLIEMSAPSNTKVFLLPLPTAKVVDDDAPGLGTIRMALGGPTWDIAREIVDSVADVVPNPAPGAVSFDPAAPADFLQTGSVMVVSERFRRVAEPHLRHVEFLPLALQTTPPGRKFGSGPVTNDYFWMNSWNRLDLANIEASEFGQGINTTTKEFSSWKMLSLKPIPADAGVFGIAGLKSGRRFISPEMHDLLKSEGLNIHFRPIMLDESVASVANAQRHKYNALLNQ